MAYACNPSYFGGGDLEHLDLRPAQSKTLAKPYLKEQARCGSPHV
jgi:hypothetical protein